MGRINLNRVMLGGLIAAVVFVVVEFVIEGIARVTFNVNEGTALREALNVAPGGVVYHVTSVVYLLVVCMLFVWVYAALRPRFGAGPRTALITTAIVMLAGLLVGVNMVNLGILPVNIVLMSLVFNLIELPLALLVGAAVYKEA